MRSQYYCCVSKFETVLDLLQDQEQELIVDKTKFVLHAQGDFHGMAPQTIVFSSDWLRNESQTRIIRMMEEEWTGEIVHGCHEQEAHKKQETKKGEDEGKEKSVEV